MIFLIFLCTTGSYFENDGHFELKHIKLDFLTEETLEFIYYMTLYVNLKENYGMFNICIIMWPPF